MPRVCFVPRVVAIAFGLSLLAGGGCWSSRPASADRAATPVGTVVPPEAWPPRDHAAAGAIAQATPKRAWLPEMQVIISGGKRPDDPPDWTDYEISHAAVYGEGVIRVIRQFALVLDFDEKMKPVSGSRKPVNEIIRFVSRSTVPNRPIGVWEYSHWAYMEMADWVAAIMANMQNATVSPRHTAVLVEGLGGKLYMPKGPARGLVIHLGGTGSARYEKSLLEDLRKRDWAMFSVPFVGISGRGSTAFSVGKDSDPRFGIVHNPPSLDSLLDPVTNANNAPIGHWTREIFPTPADLGRRFAVVSDDRVAEVAYFVEALLAYLAAEKPELSCRPLVLVASSAGALAAPAVAARIGDRLDAAVMIGGGTNMLRINLDTAFKASRAYIQWDPSKPPGPQRAEAIEAYLEASTLDPVKMAPALRRVPVLQVHATLDKIVPADGGIELWRAMGEPERLDFHGGHELLFFALDNQTDFLARWIDEHAPACRPAEAAGASLPHLVR